MYQILFRYFQADNKTNKSPLYTPGNSANEYQGDKIAPHPRFALCDMIGQSQLLNIDSESADKGHGVGLKFLMTGLLNGINASITVVKMCPPLTTKNWNIYEPLLAVGSQQGSVQILNVGNGQIEREYSVHTSAVRYVLLCLFLYIHVCLLTSISIFWKRRIYFYFIFLKCLSSMIKNSGKG